MRAKRAIIDPELDKSRSQKKRESTALQKAGEALAALTPAARASLALPPDLAEALSEWQKTKTHEAKRRQMQFIGRLIRESEDTEAILARLEDLQNNQHRQTEASARLEALRLRLLSDDEGERAAALEEALTALPRLNRTRLVHLVESARAEREKKRPPKHFRELFRYLRDGEAE